MEAVLVLIVLAVVAAVVWQAIQSSQAKQQLETKVPFSPARAADIVEQCFPGLLWRDWEGPGDINKRRRSANDSGPVVSVDISSLPDGSTHVAVWMSAWRSYAGIANFAGSARGAARKVIRRLEQV